MDKKIIIIALIGVYSQFYSQVGINTDTPNATLDIKNAPNAASFDGVIAPRVLGDDLSSKKYTINQNAAIVYVTNAASVANQIGQTEDIKTIGYYYFDFTLTPTNNTTPASTGKWVKFNNTNTIGDDKSQDVWKDVPADGTPIVGSVQSAIGPARTETNTTTIGGAPITKAVFTDTGLFGIGTINPKGILHTYSNNAVYFDRYGNGASFFLRKSAGTSPTVPVAPSTSGVGLGQIVFSGFSGETTTDTNGWNESAGTAFQSYSTEGWSASRGGTGFRFLVTPTGQNISLTPVTVNSGFRKPILQIEGNGKMIISDILGNTASTLEGSLKGRLTIQDSSPTGDALYINANLSDLSATSTGRIMVWDSTGSTVTSGTAIAGTGTNNTVSYYTGDPQTQGTGKVGYMPTTGLVKVNAATPAPTATAPFATTTALGGNFYAKDANTGIVLTSPDGGKFLITVNNDGSLSSIKVKEPIN